MLKLEHLFENFELAREVLKNYRHDEERLDESLSWFRISSNAVYPYFCKGQICFLRLCPEEEKTLENVQAEIAFIDYLLSKGYPAMKPVCTLNGDKCFTAKTQWGNYQVSAFYGVEGTSLEDTDMTVSRLQEYGRALGKLHALSGEYKPTILRPSMEEVAADIRGNLPDELLPVFEKTMQELNRLPKTKENFGLLHYDFEPDNVFFDEGTSSISVIDFDDSMYHFFALDVEQALEEMAEMRMKMPLEEAKKAFLEGYRKEHIFTKEMEKTLPLMRKFIDLHSCARLCHCLDSKPDFKPEWLENLARMLKQKQELLTRKLLQAN